MSLYGLSSFLGNNNTLCRYIPLTEKRIMGTHVFSRIAAFLPYRILLSGNLRLTSRLTL
jgi:hypothetical protein